jgi:hypothetical protein
MVVSVTFFTNLSAHVHALTLLQTMPSKDGNVLLPPTDVELIGIETLVTGSPSNTPAFPERMLVLAKKLTERSDVHRAKALASILMTDDGIVIDVNDPHA